VIPIKRRSFKISYDLSKIDKMTGFEFEEYLSDLFRKFDYVPTTTKKSGDFGCDILLKKNKQTICVQAKRSNSKISLRAVQEVTASLKKYDAESGIVIANANFTKSAKSLAKSNDITMINRNALLRLIDLSKLPVNERCKLTDFCKQLRITDSRINLLDKNKEISQKKIDDGIKHEKIDYSEILQGRPRSEVSKLQLFMDAMKSLEGEHKTPVEEKQLVKELAKTERFTEEEAKNFIRKMARDSSIYESKPGHYNIV